MTHQDLTLEELGYTELDLTIKDLADRTGLTPRMLNIYRANAEQWLGRKLGSKIGKPPPLQA